MKPLLTISVLLGLATTAGETLAAGDPVAGEKKSIICASCHGAKGWSIGPLWPNLAGQKAQYLEKQLKDFRAGKRKDPMMQPLVMQLTDEDIANLAAYYSQQPPK